MNVKELAVLKQNAMVTLHRDEEVYRLYLNPGACITTRCAPYVKEGWRVFSIELCTLGDYFNHRLDDLVETIKEIPTERKKLRDQFREGQLDFEDYLTALKVTYELEMSDLRRLYRLMHRMAYSHYECHNEEALQIYNLVF